MAIVTGFKFPFQKSATAFPASSSDNDLVRESLLQLLNTPRGTRPMRPLFGTNLMQLIFEPNDDLLAENVKAEVMSAIGRFEPRVIMRQIEVTRDTEAGTVTLKLLYVVTLTRQEQGLSMTFEAPTIG